MSVAPVGQAPNVRKRPALFRALGRQDPPLEIQVDGETYRRQEIFKHDSWAATAKYQGPRAMLVCKFNRQESIFGVPMDWLGRWLAWREGNALKRLAGLPGIPPVCGKVYAKGRALPHAVAHVYVEGHPLARDERVRQDFFPTLKHTLEQMHQRGIAYVDLHKRENILVGEDGSPHLIDFQVHWNVQAGLPFSRALFQLLCHSDNYHLDKHLLHHQGLTTKLLKDHRPWWIRLHRRIGKPLRELRRKLLSWCRIRTQQGHAETEHFPEDAVRRGRAA